MLKTQPLRTKVESKMRYPALRFYLKMFKYNCSKYSKEGCSNSSNSNSSFSSNSKCKILTTWATKLLTNKFTPT